MGAKKKRRHFTPEYKAEVVALVRKGGKTVGQVSRDLDLTGTAVTAWVRQADIDDGKGGAGPLTSAEREELAAARREITPSLLDRHQPTVVQSGPAPPSEQPPPSGHESPRQAAREGRAPS
jgi:transposase